MVASAAKQTRSVPIIRASSNAARSHEERSDNDVALQFVKGTYEQDLALLVSSRVRESRMDVGVRWEGDRACDARGDAIDLYCGGNLRYSFQSACESGPFHLARGPTRESMEEHFRERSDREFPRPLDIWHRYELPIAGARPCCTEAESWIESRDSLFRRHAGPRSPGVVLCPVFDPSIAHRQSSRAVFPGCGRHGRNAKFSG